jgi:glycosyl hydrolase family 123
LWNPNLSCNSGWYSILHAKHLYGLVRDRATGKKLTLKDLPERSKRNPKYTLIYERFMKAYVAHLKKKGWLQTAWHEKWDEPVRERIEPCKEHHAYLMKLVPDLQLFAWGLRPITDAWATGLTHAWAPNVGAWYEQQSGLERRRKAGDTLFTYTCGAGYTSPDRTQMRPDINIWDPNAQRRVYGWLYQKLGVDGMLIFAMTGWGRDNEQIAKKPNARWPASDWVVKGRNTYWLVYPAPDGAMWPSLRLDALRDGFEDYEYLHAAAQLYKKRRFKKLRKLLEVNAPLVLDREIYAQDKAAYDQRKAALARYLEKYRGK